MHLYFYTYSEPPSRQQPPISHVSPAERLCLAPGGDETTPPTNAERAFMLLWFVGCLCAGHQKVIDGLSSPDQFHYFVTFCGHGVDEFHYSIKIESL